MELIEHLIEENNMMQHKVLLFLMQPGQIDKNIAGLCANKIMAKYQRPCCILTLHKHFIYENNTVVGEELTYSGSARGCEICGAGNFKDICESFPYINYATGHQGAFGLSLPAQCIDDFIRYTDYMLQNISDEPIYYVDRIYNGIDVNKEEILTIAELDDMWGQDMPEPYVAIENLVVTPEMVTVYRKTSNTLKITLPNKLTIMKFDASEEECELLESSGYRKLNIVGRCTRNEFNGYISP